MQDIAFLVFTLDLLVFCVVVELLSCHRDVRQVFDIRFHVMGSGGTFSSSLVRCTGGSQIVFRIFS